MHTWKAAVVVLGLAATVTLFSTNNAQAGISPNNPYRSFNISGINYGSQQWERSNSKSKSSKGGSFFRSRRWR